jgi:integrase
MSQTKERFTDDRIRRWQHDGSLTSSGTPKRIYRWDSQQPGLVLQITPAGTKTFQFRQRGKTGNKHPEVITLGRYGKISLNQARKLAAELLVDLNNGIDVQEESRSLKSESTLDELFDHWLENHAKPHKKSWREDERRYELYCRKLLGNKTVSWFTDDKVRKWHRDLTKTVKSRGGKTVVKTADGKTTEITNYISPTTANRALVLLSTVFNECGYRDQQNPCKGVKNFKEKSRDRFIQRYEMKAFFDSLFSPDTPEQFRDYILLSLFTGQRRNNVLAMNWKDIDLVQNQWAIPGSETKNSEQHTVPLLPDVVTVLKRRGKNRSSVFVFPGAGKKGHYTEPKKAWKSLLKRARLENLWLHDLRRTMGSYQTMTKASTAIVGKTLGHKSPEATAVYSRLDLDPVRESMNEAAKLIEESRNIPKKIIELHESRNKG